jgi:hypothetical protein
VLGTRAFGSKTFAAVALTSLMALFGACSNGGSGGSDASGTTTTAAPLPPVAGTIYV